MSVMWALVMALTSAAAASAGAVPAVAAAAAEEAAAAAAGTLTIVAKYDNADGGVRELTLRGSALGLDWEKGAVMDEGPRGTFTLALPYTAADAGTVLEFKTLATSDTVWQMGGNSLATVADGTATVFPWFETDTGEYFVAARDVPCKFFDNTRNVIVYLPAPALENTHPDARWETLVMHDGQNVFNDSTSFGGVSWRAADTIDAGIGSGDMRPVAVVAPYNTAARMAEYTPVPDPQYDGGEGDHYLDFLTEVVLPLVAPKLRLATDRRNLGLLGSSLGGLISCYAGWTRTDYGRVGCMSSSFWWDAQWFNNTLLPTTTAAAAGVESTSAGARTAALRGKDGSFSKVKAVAAAVARGGVDMSVPPAARDTVFYMDSGDQPAPDGDDELETIGVRDHLERLGWNLGENLFYELQHGGAHNEASWGKRFYLPMGALYGPRPLEVV